MIRKVHDNGPLTRTRLVIHLLKQNYVSGYDSLDIN